MWKELERLLIIQDRDQKIASFQKDIAQFPLDEQQAKERLDNFQTAVQKAKSEIQRNSLETDKISLDVETRKNTIQRLQTQQFETRKNNEYTAIGHEIERYRAEIDEFETAQLTLMEKADTLNLTFTDAQAKFDTATTAIADEIEQLKHGITERQSQLTEILADRATLAQQIDPDILELYDRIFVAKKGFAVVRLADDHYCKGCHVKVTPSTAIQVQSQKEIVLCENCSRILHQF